MRKSPKFLECLSEITATVACGKADEWRHLRFVSYKDFSFWDTKRYFAGQAKSKYPINPLSSFIVEQRKIVKPFLSPNEDFKILGVNNKVGLFDAYMKKGGEIRQPYQKVENGFLAYNPYRVNVGSIGLKTKKQKYEFISNAYVVFSCEKNLSPEYIYKLFLTDTFNRIVRENTSGSVRQNLTFEILSGVKFPLPPVEKQKQLVEAYEAHLARATECQIQAAALEREIENYLLDELGIEIRQTEVKKGLQFVRFGDVKRWSVDFLQNQKSLEEIKEGKFPAKSFGELISYSQYGISEKSSREKNGFPMLRMNNIFQSELNLSELKFVEMSNEAVENLLLQKGDLLFNRTNSKELVGKTAVFNVEGNYLFASYLIRLKLDGEKVNVYFVNYLFNSPIVRKQIDMMSRQITGLANVNLTELKNFLIPLPPLPTQEKIVAHIGDLKAQIKTLRTEAENLRGEAKAAFEREVFEL